MIKVVLATQRLEPGGIDRALDRLGHLTHPLEGDYAVITLNTAGEVVMVYAYLNDWNYGMGTAIEVLEAPFRRLCALGLQS